MTECANSSAAAHKVVPGRQEQLLEGHGPKTIEKSPTGNSLIYVLVSR